MAGTPQQGMAIYSATVDGREIDLDEGFKAALKIMEGSVRNVFITGRPGTGKSTLVEYFRTITRKNVAVVAPTGVAALNVKGQTIHSFFGFRPDVTIDTLEKVSSHRMKALYHNLDTLVIDEISMVRADLLDCMDKFLRENGKNPESPFGGVQVIMVGDLYQLPPVVTDSEREIFRGHYRSEYFFDAHCFPYLSSEMIELKEHYRQADQNFIQLLNSIRGNTATEKDFLAINERYNSTYKPNASENYITLTSTNALADSINDSHLEKLQSQLHTFKAEYGGKFNKKVLPADEILHVKEGMQVMMLNNDAQKRWVNGSIGTVTGIGQDSKGEKISVMLTDGSEAPVGPHTWEVSRLQYDRKQSKLVPNTIGSFTQYPMMPAWAVTIHKSQGKTFDKVIIDIGNGTFVHGQLYVALSRCTSLEGIILRKKIENRHILMDKRIVEFLQKFSNS